MTNAQSEDFLAWLGVSPSGRAIVDRAAREFEESGSWVTLDTLAYEAADSDLPSMEINEIFRLPSVLGGFWSAEEFHPSALALIEATTAPRTIETMARLAQICATRKRELRDDAKIGQQVLVSEYDFDPTWARRCEHLAQTIPGLTAGGTMGDDWCLTIYRGALEYRDVHSVEDLRARLESDAKDRLRAHQRALAVAPAFAPGGIFNPETGLGQPEPGESNESIDDRAVFVIHGRDVEAKDAIWGFLADLGLHALDWEQLVIATGSGAPYVGQILEAAFQRAQAVLVLLTPDDCVKLHPDLQELGEERYELELMGQPRPNVLFEAGMAFGFNPSRTIIVEIGTTRPVSDLRGRHTVRIGTQETLRALAGRLEAAGCVVVRDTGDWSNVERFASLSAKTRRAETNGEPNERV